MPVQNSPPYGIYQPRVLNRWLDVNSQNGPLQRAGTYIIIPAFNADVVSLGYADIVCKYCYIATNNFSLVDVDIEDNPSLTFCIAFVDINGKVFRYSLNNKDNTGLYFSIPPYSNQMIQRRFQVEIWSSSISTPVRMFADLQIQTSVKQNIDYRYGVDINLATLIACPIQTPYPLDGTPPADSSVVFGNPDAGINFGNPNADIVFGQP